MKKLIRKIAVVLMAGWLGSGSLYADSTSQNSWLQDIQGFTNQVTANENLGNFSGTGVVGASSGGAQKTTKKKKSKKSKAKKSSSKAKKKKAKKPKKKKSKKSRA